MYPLGGGWAYENVIFVKMQQMYFLKESGASGFLNAKSDSQRTRH